MKFYKKALICLGAVALASTCVLAFEFGDMLTIQKTKAAFLLDEKVGQEAHEYNDTAIDFQPTPPRQDYKQTYPSYMEKYGLNFAAYYNEQGNFAPKGSDWQKWGTEGRTVAVLNWGSRDMSVYQIHATIGCVNKYLGDYDAGKSVIPVIRACSKVPDWARHQARHIPTGTYTLEPPNQPKPDFSSQAVKPTP